MARESAHDVSRLADLRHFYDTLDKVEKETGGKCLLSACGRRMDWPERGVYFLFEPGESRSDSGRGMRVVRVGTHALGGRSRTTFWNRLSQHRGVASSGSGNHRGSIFRLLIGSAIKNRDSRQEPASWGLGNDPGQAARRLGCLRRDIVEAERDLEMEVSRYLGSLPFLWIGVKDPPGPTSDRGVIERNSIALLSNFNHDVIDPPSNAWLGLHSDRARVRVSGLWNNNHVDDDYDSRFLRILERSF